MAKILRITEELKAVEETGPDTAMALKEWDTGRRLDLRTVRFWFRLMSMALCRPA